MARKDDLRTALHHVCHLLHNGFRGTAQMFESHADEFTVVCDIPERHPYPTFVRMCRERLMSTNPNAIVETRDVQPMMIYNQGPDQAPTKLHRVFLSVRQKQ
jgi:hypothetical protein